MTAIRNEVSATLRALPQVQALRRFTERQAGQHTAPVDRLACSPLAPSVRVALLLEVAHRAVMAAAAVTTGGPVPIDVVRAVSPRSAIADELLAIGVDWRDRCAGCGLLFGTPEHPGRCAPGRCAPVTGWEPGVAPEADGSGEWRG